MAQFPALPLWTDAYLADTTDLSAEEHGVYLLLLMAAWRAPDCTLPDDDQRLARMARVGSKKWLKIRPVMERFFTVGVNGWTQKRLLSERSRVETSRSQASQAGKASALKRKKTTSTDVGTEQETEIQESISISIKNTEPNGSGADAPNVEKEYFDEGKALLSKNAGGLLARLAKAQSHDYPACIEILTTAKTKQDPKEWIAAHCRDRPAWERDAEREAQEQRERLKAI